MLGQFSANILIKLGFLRINEIITVFLSNIFQTNSLGALIDLRTLMAGLLDPTTSRMIIKDAQESRILYFRLRIGYVFLQCYLNVNLILSKTLERRIAQGLHDFERVDPEDFVALRKLGWFFIFRASILETILATKFETKSWHVNLSNQFTI